MPLEVEFESLFLLSMQLLNLQLRKHQTLFPHVDCYLANCSLIAMA